nr:hypothetical protein [uncultured Actinoplanes sp.]
MTDPRLHSPFCPRGWPPGRRRLDIRTDDDAFPVWGWFTLPARPGHPAREVHGNIGPRALGLSGDLAADLRDWAHAGRSPGWDERGRALAGRLESETGALVVYRWPANGRDPGCPDCPP